MNLHHGDGLEVLRTKQWDHVITDPDYKNQPDVSVYQEHCRGNIILFCDPRKRPSGPPPDEVLFWMKPLSTKWSTKRCNCFVEEILVYRGKDSVFNPIHWSSMTGIFNDTFLDKNGHPYEKPLTLIEKLVLMYTNPGQLVLDPFCGSGTSGVACYRNGREWEGAESDVQRYKQAYDRLVGE